MGVPFIQQIRVGSYVIGKKLKGEKRYPLVLMLEPLFRCNLACPGCGKIDYPDAILNRRLSVEECLEAVDECGAPMVSIPGGEPLIQVREKGFRCNVNSTFFNNIEANEAAAFFDFCATLGVEGITVSPGYSYERAPDQEHFLTRRATKQLYRDVLKLGKGKKWPLSQSSLFLDFLAGNQTYRCTPWGNPTRNIFGWQRPCYLLGEGYVKTFAELLGGTDWEKYGTGAYEKCSNCMVHCGYEPTAVEETFTRPWKALWVRLRGVRTDGPMAPEIAFDQARSAEYVFEENVEKALSKVERKDGGGQSHAA
jgi:MoaA/NifB/PqqE/SkfB family radical SAM enzyme